MKSKKALFVIAFDGFRDEEYLEPKNILKAGGIDVVTVSTQLGNAKGKLGMVTPIDYLYNQVDVKDYSAVVFIGGPGSVKYWEDDDAHKIIKSAAENDIVIGGICSAAVTLAKAGVLKDKKATVWHGDKEIFEELVGSYTGAGCQKDGKCITANGPDSAYDFGNILLKEILNS